MSKFFYTSSDSVIQGQTIGVRVGFHLFQFSGEYGIHDHCYGGQAHK